MAGSRSVTFQQGARPLHSDPALIPAITAMTVLGCGESPQTDAAAFPESARDVFFSWEHRLIQADSVDLEFPVGSGPVRELAYGSSEAG